DPRSDQWTIHWANSTTGTLDPPMTGRFVNGRGEFYNQEAFEGRAIYVRFVWTTSDAEHARWEQAYSDDGGTTWETNWIMELTRASEPTAVARCCPIVELRQYTLYPGQRETLISMFDREFLESQEAAGMQVIAQFRDIDRPDVFTWLR